MVSHHPKDGHPQSKIYKKVLYYRIGNLHIALTHKIKTTITAIDGQPPFLGWSATIPMMVSHHPKYSILSFDLVCSASPKLKLNT